MVRSLRNGSSGYTCYPQQDIIGPMCNEPVWERADRCNAEQEAVQNPIASACHTCWPGEGTALGVSNSDPYATEPDQSSDWVKEGPHLMIVVPAGTSLKGLSTDPNDPVYVMWRDTPYAHIMVKIADDE